MGYHLAPAFMRKVVQTCSRLTVRQSASLTSLASHCEGLVAFYPRIHAYTARNKIAKFCKRSHCDLCYCSFATDHMTGLGSAALLSALHRRLVQISSSQGLTVV